MDFDSYEMKEKEQEGEQEMVREREENREEVEEETNFDNIDDVLIDIGTLEDRITNLDEVPNVGVDVGNIRRAITNDVKKVFRSVFDVSIEKKNGESSRKVLENTKFISSKNGKVSIEFKGSRVGWVERDGNVELFEKKNKKLVGEFRETMELAKLEYEKVLVR